MKQFSLTILFCCHGVIICLAAAFSYKFLPFDSQRDGLESAVTVLDAAVALVLSHLREGLEAGDRLLQVTQGAWRKSLSQLLVALRIDHLHIRGYSIRRGGATFQFRMEGRFERKVLSNEKPWALPWYQN